MKHNPKDFAAIKARVEKTRVTQRKFINQDDAEWLYEFAAHVIDELGLDLTHPPTYFMDGEPEMGVPDVDDLASCMVIGEEIMVHVGYYTAPESYRLLPTEEWAHTGHKICSGCEGKGCGDWAGEDCYSDHTRLFRVRDLPAGHDK